MENIRAVNRGNDREEERLLNVLRSAARTLGHEEDLDYLLADGYFMKPVPDGADGTAAGIRFEHYSRKDKSKLAADLLDPNAFVFIYDVEMQARYVELNKDKTALSVSEPLGEVLTRPESPSWVTKLLAVFFKSFRRDVEKFEAKKKVYDAYVRTKTLDDISRKLDDVFKETEKAGHGDFSRLDYITIGGRTLRGILTQEVINDRPEDIKGKSNVLLCNNRIDERKKLNELMTDEHIRDVICAAIAEGRQVEYVQVDPVTRSVIPDENGKSYHVFEPAEEVAKMKPAERKALFEGFRERTKVSVSFDLFEDRREQWAAMDVCRGAVERSALVFRSSGADLNSGTMRQELFGSWLEKNGGKLPDTAVGLGTSFSLERGTLQAFTLAYLVTEGGMTVDEVFSPADEAARAIKDKAAEHIINEMTSGSGDLDKLISVGIRGQMKLAEYIRNNAEKIGDPTDPERLCGVSAATIMSAAGAIYELSQECPRSDESKRATVKALTELGVITEKEPEKAQKQYNDYLSSMLDHGDLRHLNYGQKEIIAAATGNAVEGSARQFCRVGEKYRSHVAEGLKQHKPADKLLTVTDMNAMTVSTMMEMEDRREPMELRSFAEGSTFSRREFVPKSVQQTKQAPGQQAKDRQPQPASPEMNAGGVSLP